jgi:hypothetical protein
MPLLLLALLGGQVDDAPPPPPPAVDELEEPPPSASAPDVATPDDEGADKASAEEGARTPEERSVIQPGRVATLYGLMVAPATVGACLAGISPCFVLVGPQALFLTCGTACGIMGFFPVLQGVMGWLISDELLGMEADLMWIMLGAYGSCAAIMPLALIIGLTIGLAGIIEVGNLNTGLGWSYAPFVPQPDPTSLLVGSLVVPVGVMVMGAMAQTVGPTAAAMLTAQERPELSTVKETPMPRRRRQSMRF